MEPRSSSSIEEFRAWLLRSEAPRPFRIAVRAKNEAIGDFLRRESEEVRRRGTPVISLMSRVLFSPAGTDLPLHLARIAQRGRLIQVSAAPPLPGLSPFAWSRFLARRREQRWLLDHPGSWKHFGDRLEDSAAFDFMTMMGVDFIALASHGWERPSQWVRGAADRGWELMFSASPRATTRAPRPMR